MTIPLPNPILGEFWVRDAEQIDRDLALLRAVPPSFHDEEPLIQAGLDFDGPGAWVVTRHADIVAMSKQPTTFCSGKGITVFDTPPEFNEFFGSMIAMDDPRHARLRKLVSAGFTPRMLGELDASVQQIAAEIVGTIDGELDFVVDVAAALPLRIVCDLMGIPASQYRYVFDQTNIILGGGDPEYRIEGTNIATAGLEAGGNLAALMADVAAAKRGGDGTDLTSILVNAEVDGERLSDSDVASFFILLVVAGNETTRNAISWGLHLLTRHPDQRAIWWNDFEAVAPFAVEEIVRIASPVTYMRRTATVDTEVGGQAIAEGDKLLMMYLAANRDESVFADPTRFDLQRDPNPHIGFGGPGPHFCLGAHLARREIAVMFREIHRQVPTLETTAEPDLLRSSFIHGIKHLSAAPR